MADDSLITDEARAMIGKESEPVVGEVYAKEIRRFCFSVGDENPLYLDDEAAAKSKNGGIVAPPMFFEIPTVQEFSQTELKDDGLPSKSNRPPLKVTRSMAGGNEVEFFKPMRPGDVITRVSKITEMFEKEGRTGRLVFTVFEHKYTNQDGEVVAVATQTGISR